MALPATLSASEMQKLGAGSASPTSSKGGMPSTLSAAQMQQLGAVAPPAQNTQSLFNPVADAIGKGGQQQSTGILSSIFQNTLGSKGLLGVAQLPGKVLGAPGAIQSATESQQAAGSTYDQGLAYMKQAQQTTDPTKKGLLVNAAKQLLQSGQLLQGQGNEMTQKFDTTPEQALGTGLNAATTAAGFGTGGLATTIPRAIGVGGILGATSGAGQAMSNNASAKDVAIQAGVGGVLGAATAGLTSGLGALLQKSGSGILNTVIKPSRADIADGFDMQTIKDYNLGGSLSTMYDKTEQKLGDLSQQLNQKLQGSGAEVNLNDVVDNTVKSLSSNKLQGFGANTSIKNAVEQLKGEVSNIAENGNLSVPDAQLVKQAAGRFGAWQYGMTDPESTARQTVYNAFYTQLKDAIEKNSPEGVKGINAQLSKLIPVANAIVRRIPVSERNSALSLTDMLTLTASILDPRALAGFGISLAQKSGAFGNALMKLGPKIQSLAPATGAITGGILSNLSKQNTPMQ